MLCPTGNKRSLCQFLNTDPGSHRRFELKGNEMVLQGFPETRRNIGLERRPRPQGWEWASQAAIWVPWRLVRYSFPNSESNLVAQRCSRRTETLSAILRSTPPTCLKLPLRLCSQSIMSWKIGIMTFRRSGWGIKVTSRKGPIRAGMKWSLCSPKVNKTVAFQDI